MSRLIAVLLFVLFARPTTLTAQTAPAGSLVPGARLRITQNGEKSRVAILVARTADTLVVQWPEFTNSVSLPVSGISRLEVSTGRHRRVVKGMLLGGVGAGTVGFLVGAAAYQPCTTNCFLAPASREESGAVGGIVLGTLGLVIGGLTGLARHDTWKRVPLDGSRVAVEVRPRAQGNGLAVALRF